MRNGEYEGFIRAKAEARSGLVDLVATYLSGETDPMVIGEIAGALTVISAMSYSHGHREFDDAVEAAHHRNRRAKQPCGCGTRQRCVLPEVDLDRLIRALTFLDNRQGLRIGMAQSTGWAVDNGGWDLPPQW